MKVLPFASLLRIAFALTLISASTLLATRLVQAQTFTTLHDFSGQNDGGTPTGVLIRDRAGNLYGTASTGGNNTCSPAPSCGVVYKLTHTGSSWLFSTIYAFHGPDGATPEAGVIIGPDGNLYGTTSTGGAAGAGVVFRLQPPATICKSVSCSWTETVLHSFFVDPQDGTGPSYGPLVFDRAGNIYGTTIGGGASAGTVFEMSPSNGGWVEKVIYSFQGEPDGAQPACGVVFDADGNLYGTTVTGGTGRFGTVFELAPAGSGWTESVLYRFTDGPEGYGPFAGVILDGSGNLYGATAAGNITVYELIPSGGSWTFQVLFPLNAYFGSYESLTFDSAGNLLGTVYAGTPEVFRLTPSNGQWTLTGFNGNDGGFSLSNVIQDASGNLYATSSAGGAYHQGTVFEITP